MNNSLAVICMNNTPKLTNSKKKAPTLGPDTKTRTREPQEQEADNIFVPRGPRSRINGRSGQKNWCFVQLFREMAENGPAGVTNSTKPRTMTGAREELEQEDGIKSHHAVPRYLRV